MCLVFRTLTKQKSWLLGVKARTWVNFPGLKEYADGFCISAEAFGKRCGFLEKARFCREKRRENKVARVQIFFYSTN
jgi:hypothetical protein